ncbi:Hypothetical protein Nlim_1265 [Candidatus Nitrosarchaeum limnium SFB1]|uniref:Thioredoxin-like fold domain-containing protein n=1 Tax=Candidatus Nitrosarchaeum limnium SFB1 TaxID=886738 RepID=F3KL88_9ARCH|nr:Hypothetical protein Nlim_1265 [Candidatus Nitrosarchaeum limnium SFB1]
MLEQLGVKYDVIDVTEKPEYLEKYPIFMAPGLVIDGKLEFTGIPKKTDLEKNSHRFTNVFYSGCNIVFK